MRSEIHCTFRYRAIHWPLPVFLLILMQFPSLLAGPPPSQIRAEKLAGQMRTRYVELTGKLNVPAIRADSLKNRLGDTNLVLIDVRQPNEQAVSMLPNALTTLEFAERFRTGIPEEKTFVCYCTLGYRSALFALELSKQKISCLNLEGGMLAWSHIEQSFYEKDARGNARLTHKVHVYSKEWNFLHPNYEAVW